MGSEVKTISSSASSVPGLISRESDEIFSDWTANVDFSVFVFKGVVVTERRFEIVNLSVELVVLMMEVIGASYVKRRGMKKLLAGRLRCDIPLLQSIHSTLFQLDLGDHFARSANFEKKNRGHKRDFLHLR